MIVAFEEDYGGGGFSSSALLHKLEVKDTNLELPPLSKLSSTLSFLCNAYHIHNAYPRRQRRNYRNFGKSNFIVNHDVLKTVIISSDASMSNPNYASLCDLKAVAHLYDRKLAVLSLRGGAMNNDWETGFCDSTFEDIVHYKGQLYAVDESGAAFVMDDNSLRMFSHEPHTVVKPKLYKLSSSPHWVEADRDLPDQVFVKDVRCNFHVARDLIRRRHAGLWLDVPRICSFPDFVFVRISVGF